MVKKKKRPLRKKTAKGKKKQKVTKVHGKTFVIIAKISGKAEVVIRGAENEEEAKQHFWDGKYNEKDETLIEWEYHDIDDHRVEEVK